MNRLFLVRHGGSTGNAQEAFYNYNDSALCLTTDGVRQALATGEMLAEVGGPRWMKPGNFALEVYASEYYRAQQTARICLDQMGILSVTPKIRTLLNERNYGTAYKKIMDQEADCTENDSESSIRARVRARAFIAEIEPVLETADVLAFSHEGLLRAMVANLLGYTDEQMMLKLKHIPNGHIFLFHRALGADGSVFWEKQALPDHLVPKASPTIERPPVGLPRNLRPHTL